MPHLESVFARYTLTDEFEDSDEFKYLYTELTGAIDLMFKEDGV